MQMVTALCSCVFWQRGFASLISLTMSLGNQLMFDCRYSAKDQVVWGSGAWCLCSSSMCLFLTLVFSSGMLRKLEIRNEEDLQSVSAVATHMFSDGITNWGRVVTLISFGAFVVKHLKSINQENCINTLAGIITDLLVTDKRDWLVSQRGWVSELLQVLSVLNDCAVPQPGNIVLSPPNSVTPRCVQRLSSHAD